MILRTSKASLQSSPSRLLTCKTRCRRWKHATGSAKLFADAEREEFSSQAQQQKSPQLLALEQQHENWTGDERMEDAVLRMLVDKYKPLRSGTVRTAEQKIQAAMPTITPRSTPPNLTPEQPSNTQHSASWQPPATTIEWKAKPLLPSSEEHRPWHTEYKVPSHVTSSVKFARFPLQPRTSTSSTPMSMKEPQDRQKEREIRKRDERAGRLDRARESTLDYRLGMKLQKMLPGMNQQHAQGGRPNPVSLKRWGGLVEDRIERARQKGVFNNIKGRGQPLARTTEERNPFIAREEFLMNRIVQRNGAAPPWVELQAELEEAASNFRTMLRQSWTRRALRLIGLQHPPSHLLRLTEADIQRLRDPGWETREQSFHDAAMNELNALVRKYNGVAPYAVRRPYYMRTVELEKMYEESVGDVWQGVLERAMAGRTASVKAGEDGDGATFDGVSRAGDLRLERRGVFTRIRRWFGFV